MDVERARRSTARRHRAQRVRLAAARRRRPQRRRHQGEAAGQSDP